MVNTKEKAPAEKVIKLHWDFSKWNGRDYLETWLDIGSELQDFVAERIREDVLTQHRILHSHTPGELKHIQAEYVQKAMDDYAAKTGRLVELGNKLMTPPN
ncbi:hypothetical protein [Phaeobacter sp. 22II1-1F12B]|uniref:hypothetical protein n=1 Tax=Phaeobacter sp. 22II1-1F12B TaxID=1317111 RepID=UPI000B51F58B|nr:hypothetical protein [Phaeobacter sp. 22II1-1F12B]